MTLFDLFAVAVIVIYVLLGYFTGMIRRVIGLVTVYLACVVATYMGIQGGSIVQQQDATITIPDSRIYAWVGFFLLIIVVVEGLAVFIHNELQLSIIMLNKATGVLVGAVTAVVVVLVTSYILAGYGQPLGSGAPDDLQIKVRDAVANSKIGLPIAKLAAPALTVFDAALPRDPKTYFGISSTKAP